MLFKKPHLVRSLRLFTLSILALLILSACATPTKAPLLALKHDAAGSVEAGSVDRLVSAIRSGCGVRVAWGARRKNDPTSTIEHIAEPLWVSVRNGQEVEVQLEGFAANLKILGEEPKASHRFLPSDRLVKWRANLKTDGSFNAIWYLHETGELVRRIPQNHPMSWFADCDVQSAQVLYPAMTE